MLEVLAYSLVILMTIAFAVGVLILIAMSVVILRDFFKK